MNENVAIYNRERQTIKSEVIVMTVFWHCLLWWTVSNESRHLFCLERKPETAIRNQKQKDTVKENIYRPEREANN